MICYGKDSKTKKNKEMIKENNRRGLNFWVVTGQFQKIAQRAEKKLKNFSFFFCAQRTKIRNHPINNCSFFA